MRPEEINGSRQRLIPPVDSNRGVAQSVNVSQGSKLPKAAFTKYRGPGAALDIDALFDGLQARKAEAATASDVEDKKKKVCHIVCQGICWSVCTITCFHILS